MRVGHNISVGATEQHARPGLRPALALRFVPPRNRTGAVSRPASGASLVEILGTVAVIGVISAAAIPAIRSYRADPMAAASRQLLSDLAMAREQAMADHTTVFLVFVPALDNLRPELRTELPPADLQRLLAGQYVSYALYEKRSGRDPADHSMPRYLTDWKTLPAGTAIAPQKFGNGIEPSGEPVEPGLFRTFDYINSGKIFFNPQNGLYPSGFSGFPCIAFDYQGRLVSPWDSWRGYDCVIPLTRGRVHRALDLTGENFAPVAATFNEETSGSWKTAQNYIVIDGPTGRARLVRK